METLGTMNSATFHSVLAPSQTPVSDALRERAAVIPGRSMTRSKAPGRYFGALPGPIYASHGVGAELFDMDGRRYIDMVCALGAISLGYEPTNVLSARSQVFSLPSHEEVHAAEAVLTHVAPWAGSVRFVKTGSEATHAAYRIAKAATGRRIVLVLDGSYHGWHEWATERAAWNSDGFARCFDGPETLAFAHDAGLDLLEQESGGIREPLSCDVAAVFIEPPRWRAFDRDWLLGVRAFCNRVGALLVFDEMIYGGRWALGGATEYFDVRPDLACYGKALGNGASVAFVVGRRDLMDAHGEMVSGTYSGDVAGLSAVTATVRAYTQGRPLEVIWQRGRQLQRGLDSVLAEAGLGGRVVREGMPVHQRLRWAKREDAYRFSSAMASRGVLWHPDVVNVCAAHTREQIELVVEAAGECLLEMK